MKKGIIALLSLMLLASCSGEDDAQRVSQQKIDNPTAANDLVATAKQLPADSGENAAANNPFTKPIEDTGHQTTENSEDAYDDGDVAEPEAGEGLAIRESETGYLEWDAPAEVSYSKAEVTIVDSNGKRLQRSFAPGEAIVVQESLPDGHYMWESVVTPEIDPYVREEMQAARESGNFDAEQALIARLRAEGSLPTEAQAQENRKSGSFRVTDGVAKPIPPTYVDDEPQHDGEG